MKHLEMQVYTRDTQHTATALTQSPLRSLLSTETVSVFDLQDTRSEQRLLKQALHHDGPHAHFDQQDLTEAIDVLVHTHHILNYKQQRRRMIIRDHLLLFQINNK